MIMMYFAKPKAAVKLDLFFNKPASTEVYRI